MSDLLDALNDEQRLAVENFEGYVRLHAGAGTGKTRTLTYRYAYLVSVLGIPPKSVWCCTFTNKAASEMKERIISLCGDVGDPFVSTFHSFCVSFLKEEIIAIGWPKNFSIWDVNSVKSVLRPIYEECGIDGREFPMRKAWQYIDTFKEEQSYIPDIIDADTAQLLTRSDMSKELGPKIFWRYLFAQRTSYALDFDDLILFTLHILRHFPEIRAKWQERLEFIMVDEFQDIDRDQYELVEILAGKHHNLFIVGDPDQTIYSWRGARVNYFNDFILRHGGTPQVIDPLETEAVVQAMEQESAKYERIHATSERSNYVGGGRPEIKERLTSYEQATASYERQATSYDNPTASYARQTALYKQHGAYPSSYVPAHQGIAKDTLPEQYVRSERSFQEYAQEHRFESLHGIENPKSIALNQVQRELKTLGAYLKKPDYPNYPESFPNRQQDFSSFANGGSFRQFATHSHDFESNPRANPNAYHQGQFQPHYQGGKMQPYSPYDHVHQGNTNQDDTYQANAQYRSFSHENIHQARAEDYAPQESERQHPTHEHYYERDQEPNLRSYDGYERELLYSRELSYSREPQYPRDTLNTRNTEVPSRQESDYSRDYGRFERAAVSRFGHVYARQGMRHDLPQDPRLNPYGQIERSERQAYYKPSSEMGYDSYEDYEQAFRDLDEYRASQGIEFDAEEAQYYAQEPQSTFSSQTQEGYDANIKSKDSLTHSSSYEPMALSLMRSDGNRIPKKTSQSLIQDDLADSSEADSSEAYNGDLNLSPTDTKTHNIHDVASEDKAQEDQGKSSKDKDKSKAKAKSLGQEVKYPKQSVNLAQDQSESPLESISARSNAKFAKDQEVAPAERLKHKESLKQYQSMFSKDPIAVDLSAFSYGLNSRLDQRLGAPDIEIVKASEEVLDGSYEHVSDYDTEARPEPKTVPAEETEPEKGEATEQERTLEKSATSKGPSYTSSFAAFAQSKLEQTESCDLSLWLENSAQSINKVAPLVGALEFADSEEIEERYKQPAPKPRRTVRMDAKAKADLMSKRSIKAHDKE